MCSWVLLTRHRCERDNECGRIMSADVVDPPSFGTADGMGCRVANGLLTLIVRVARV